MFRVEIDTSNDAFGHEWYEEVGRLLRDIAKRICEGELDGALRDANGNCVGVFEMEPTDDEVTE